MRTEIKFQLVYNWIFIPVWNECRNGYFKKPVEINRGKGLPGFFYTFSMALYHKWDVKNGFTYVLTFFSLISDGLGCVYRFWGRKDAFFEVLQRRVAKEKIVLKWALICGDAYANEIGSFLQEMTEKRQGWQTSNILSKNGRVFCADNFSWSLK